MFCDTPQLAAGSFIRLVIKNDKQNRTITLPTSINDVAKVQIWCAYAEVLLGEASFAKPIVTASGEARGNGMRAEHPKAILHRILEGVEAKVGEEFFPSLVRQLATTLGVDFAYI